MANDRIRSAAHKSGVKLWELAYRLGMSDFALSKKMRFEFSDEDTKKALACIDEIARERKEGA